jgi:hypothetical protein
MRSFIMCKLQKILLERKIKYNEEGGHIAHTGQM